MFNTDSTAILQYIRHESIWQTCFSGLKDVHFLNFKDTSIYCKNITKEYHMEGVCGGIQCNLSLYRYILWYIILYEAGATWPSQFRWKCQHSAMTWESLANFVGASLSQAHNGFPAGHTWEGLEAEINLSVSPEMQASRNCENYFFLLHTSFRKFLKLMWLKRLRNKGLQ